MSFFFFFSGSFTIQKAYGAKRQYNTATLWGIFRKTEQTERVCVFFFLVKFLSTQISI